MVYSENGLSIKSCCAPLQNVNVQASSRDRGIKEIQANAQVTTVSANE